MRKHLIAVLAVAALALPANLAAQNNQGIITASANVQAPLNVSVDQGLSFGTVLPGVNKTVAPGDAAAGRLQVAGAGIFQVSLDFGTLPTDLSDGGSNTMPIVFGAGSAGHGTSSGSVGTTFDPATGANANLSAGTLWVFLGGQVQPAVDQAAGSYNADITVTVDYTGS